MINKEDDECLDQAGRECVKGNDIQDDVGEKMMGGSEESKGIVMDSEVIVVQFEDDGIGVVGNDGKMSFVSVSEDMIKMYDGTSSDNRSKKVELQGNKESIQGIDENGVEVVVFDDVMMAEGNLNLDNTKLDKIPLWVKLCNVPLEAWTMKGISALASRLGKPLVMDSITANKCKQGIGMVRYARVLIEVSAKKILPNDVEIVIKILREWFNVGKLLKLNMTGNPQCAVNVEWNNAVNTEQKEANEQKEKNRVHVEDSDEGFVEVKRKKNIVYQAKTKEVKSPKKTPTKMPEAAEGIKKRRLEVREIVKKWSAYKDILEAMKRSANKYSLFELYDVNDQNELKELKDMKIVDNFLNKRIRPYCMSMKEMEH
ncbi:zinc knuckle CX2CX4HX4C containing protein [Tanacetum coccineum]